MKAFVQVHTDNEFYNENAYSAWRAFNHYGYETIKFKHHEINRLEITRETPCYAGVDTTKAIFSKLKIHHEELESYPECLRRFLYRNLEISTVGELHKRVCSGRPTFGKPLDEHRKFFNGKLFKGELDLVGMMSLGKDFPVVICDPIEFISEYRVFIYKDEILDARKYKGPFHSVPSLNVIKNMIYLLKVNRCNPIAYCLDVGTAFPEDEEPCTVLVETTDAWAFGHYGLDMVYFGKMIIERWNEIVNKM